MVVVIQMRTWNVLLFSSFGNQNIFAISWALLHGRNPSKQILLKSHHAVVNLVRDPDKVNFRSLSCTFQYSLLILLSIRRMGFLFSGNVIHTRSSAGSAPYPQVSSHPLSDLPRSRRECLRKLKFHCLRPGLSGVRLWVAHIWKVDTRGETEISKTAFTVWNVLCGTTLLPIRLRKWWPRVKG